MSLALMLKLMPTLSNARLRNQGGHFWQIINVIKIFLVILNKFGDPVFLTSYQRHLLSSKRFFYIPVCSLTDRQITGTNKVLCFQIQQTFLPMICVSGNLKFSLRCSAYSFCLDISHHFLCQWCFVLFFFIPGVLWHTVFDDITRFPWTAQFVCTQHRHTIPARITPTSFKGIRSHTHTRIQPHPASGSLLLQPDGAISQKPDKEQLFSWSHPYCSALTPGETHNLASLPQSELFEPAGEAPRMASVWEREGERDGSLSVGVFLSVQNKRHGISLSHSVFQNGKCQLQAKGINLQPNTLLHEC